MMTLVKLIDVLVRAVQTLLGHNDAPGAARAALWTVVLVGFTIALAVGVGALVLGIAWLESRGAQWM